MTTSQTKIKRDPERTRQRILAAAIEEFAERGSSGARVDSIARRADINERMLYYYFKNKDELFLAVMEDTYRGIRDAEAELRLLDLPIRIGHGGHGPSFSRQRMHEIAAGYLQPGA